jgi:heme/copper-type cytochrome/quinol oxidase subunit 2
MPLPYADVLFWVAVVATVVAQFFILRSTARGMRVATGRTGGQAALEWMWAVLPAVSLIALFLWTWRTIHPATPGELPAQVAFIADAGVVRE